MIFPTRDVWELMSSRTALLVILAFHGIRRSLLQHHSSKASIFLWSPFVMVLVSQSCVAIGNTLAVTNRRLVVIETSLHFYSWFMFTMAVRPIVIRRLMSPVEPPL